MATQEDNAMPAELAALVAEDWHRRILQFYGDGAGKSVARRLEDLLNQIEREQAAAPNRKSKYTTRAQALDLMCASFPAGHPPPEALVHLMRLLLGLPSDHGVGGWVIELGAPGKVSDRRGAPKRDERMLAASIELKREGLEPMGTRAVARELGRQLGRRIEPRLIREWRKDTGYCEMADLPEPKQSSAGLSNKRGRPRGGA
jgi:hypothetical protein